VVAQDQGFNRFSFLAERRERARGGTEQRAASAEHEQFAITRVAPALDGDVLDGLRD
jgi:hypothetical protein